MSHSLAPSSPALRVAHRAAGLPSSEIRDLLRVTQDPVVLSLAGGLPATEALPLERIGVAADRALAVTGRYGPLALQYGPTEGLDALRELIGAGTDASPALGSPEQVLVTTGSQQGLDLLARVMLDPGDPVGVEDPVYLGARQVFTAHDATIVGIPTDRDGLDTNDLAGRLSRGWRPRVVYCVPNFSNPSGATLSDERRVHLGALAQHYGFVVIEDDPYHALGFDAPAPRPVATNAPDHTVTLGSASKVVAPGLRVGWLHAPDWLVRPLTTAKQTLDLHTATLPQLIVADLLGDRAFLASHLETTRTRHRRRANALHHALDGVVDVPLPSGGMFLWGRAAVDTRAAFADAVASGVAYVPGDAFTVDRDGTRYVRVSFATLAEGELRTAADRLRRTFASRVSSA